MPGQYTLRQTYVDGDILSASDYVADNQQHIDNQTPSATDDQSANVTQMRTVTDHGDVNTESLATTLAGELERLRYAIKHIKEKINGAAITQWYAKSYSVTVANSSITSAKLANGATYIQAVKGTGSSVAIATGSDTTLATSAITTTRSRVRVSANAAVLGALADGLPHTVTFKLKRGSTTLATKTGTFHATGGGSAVEANCTKVFVEIDNPGAGTYSYTITGNGGAGIIAVAEDAEILVEEIA